MGFTKKQYVWAHSPLLGAQHLFAFAEVIPGGADRWACLAEGKSSSQLVDVLLEEIGTGALKEINVFPGWVRASFLLCLFLLRLIGSKYPLGRWVNWFRG